MISIRKSFSTKLSLGILLLAAPIFIVSMGVLYKQSRQMIRKEALGYAASVLNAAIQRVSLNLRPVVTATDASDWLVLHYRQPDSLLNLSHRIVQLNPHIDGCSISAEPDVFPEYGRYFSVYSIRDGDSIISVFEEKYEYFEKTWYKTPKEMGKPCWVVYYDEADSLELTLSGKIASYCKPLYDEDNQLFAVISTDLSLLRLSKVFTEEKPFPNSYFMMVDKRGQYYIHPDTTKLFNHTIFDDADPTRQTNIIALGHEMTTGNQGSMSVDIDGTPCLVCYQPVPGTSWSLALVCPDIYILQGYHQLNYILFPLLIIGLLVILWFCHRVVAHAIRPLNQLLGKTQTIAAGNMEVYIPKSQRVDAVGRLQNSFSSMLQSLNFHMGIVRYINEQTTRRNEELIHATRMAKEADRQKTTFFQNVTHQIRTPLNIIMGFAQVLRDASHSSDSDPSYSGGLREEDMKSITYNMEHNSKLLFRMLLMLFDSSDTGLTEELKTLKHDKVPCNDMAREAIGFIKLRCPKLHLQFQTEVDDNFCVQTSHLYLLRSLQELLYNAAKYSDGKHVSLCVSADDSTVKFIVEDTGKGIAEADRELIFKFFTKVDDLSEGLGLGLPLAKRHARNLGGDLILDTQYHDGCRFIIEIPLE